MTFIVAEYLISGVNIFVDLKQARRRKIFFKSASLVVSGVERQERLSRLTHRTEGFVRG